MVTRIRDYRTKTKKSPCVQQHKSAKRSHLCSEQSQAIHSLLAANFSFFRCFGRCLRFTIPAEAQISLFYGLMCRLFSDSILLLKRSIFVANHLFEAHRPMRILGRSKLRGLFKTWRLEAYGFVGGSPQHPNSLRHTWQPQDRSAFGHQGRFIFTVSSPHAPRHRQHLAGNGQTSQRFFQAAFQ